MNPKLSIIVYKFVSVIFSIITILIGLGENKRNKAIKKNK